MAGLDHFNLLAPFYDRAIPMRNRDELIELLALPVEGDLLDAGGGTGRAAAALKGLARQVVVADPSSEMLKQAELKGGLRLAQAEAERLPFGQGAFERVFMVDALHHVIDQRQTIAELYRVLAPRGRLAVVEPDLKLFSVKLVAVVEKLALMRSHILHIEAIAAMFNGLGAWVRIERRGFNGWVIVEKPRRNA